MNISVYSVVRIKPSLFNHKVHRESTKLHKDVLTLLFLVQEFGEVFVDFVGWTHDLKFHVEFSPIN